MITSAQNAKLRLVRTLQGRPKERREAGAFLAEGVRLVEEALAADWPFRFVLHGSELSQRAQALLEQLTSRGIEVEETAPALLEATGETETTQGILAVLECPAPRVPDLETLDFVLVPDQVRDPGNLGTLLRSAAAAGAQAVFLPPETVDVYNPKVVRAAMGAHFRLALCSLEWASIRACTRDLTVFLADASGPTSCWTADFKPPLALILGGEADGASQSARKMADHVVNIPMPGKIESLNAAVAGAVLMFEVVRQRMKD
jgi:TrmH family RNA methyltransferase